MSNVIDITSRRGRDLEYETRLCPANYWGVCPECWKTDGYINIGKGHWFYCREHRVCWFIESNLFSSWRDETEEQQRRLYDELEFGSFRETEPLNGHKLQPGAPDRCRFCGWEPAM